MIVSTPFLIIPGFDMRTPKEVIGLMLALSCILIALFHGEIKRYRNYWVLAFIGFMYVGILLAPDFREYALAFVTRGQVNLLLNRSVAELWMFKSFSYILIYILFMIVVVSREFEKKEILMITFLMALCGFLMSGYVLIQRAGLDQFFSIIPLSVDHTIAGLPTPEIGGFLGQATVVAPFIAMTVPLALYLKKYIWVIVMVLAICFTVSKVGMVSVGAGLMFYLFFSTRKYYKAIATVLILVLIVPVVIGLFAFGGMDKVVAYCEHQSSGRVGAWVDIWQSFSEGYNGKKFTITGMGAGSFRQWFSVLYNNKWWQAHCDPLEALINFGIAGMCLLLLAIRKFCWKVFKNKNELIVAFTASAFTIVLSSFGTFSLQIAPNIIYLLIILGLLQNKNIRRMICLDSIGKTS